MNEVLDLQVPLKQENSRPGGRLLSTSTVLHSTLLHVTVQKADKHNLPGPRRMRVHPSKLRPYIHMAWVNNLLIISIPNNVT